MKMSSALRKNQGAFLIFKFRKEGRLSAESTAAVTYSQLKLFAPAVMGTSAQRYGIPQASTAV